MKQKLLFIFLSFTLLFLGSVSLTFAGIPGIPEGVAPANLLPSSAQPGQITRALKEQEFTPSPQAPALVTQEKAAPTPGGEQAKKIKFKLNGIILEGNTVYTDAQLEVLYKKALKTTISVADLFQIVQSITNYYRNNGYILSRAILPPQHVKNGVVKIKIIEGFIDKTAITGKPLGAKCWVQLLGCNIKRCRPLLLKRMERNLLIANQTPSTSVKAVLAPSKATTGAADLSLVTENKIINGYFSYDNYGTRYIGPQQMTGNLQLNSFASSGDLGQITFTKTPKGDELTYVDINYNTPITDDGSRWYIGGTRAFTHPLFILEPTNTEGLTNNYYTSVQYPMILTRSESLLLQAGFNYLDSNVTILDQQLYTDHIRSIAAGVTYNFADNYSGVNAIYADVRQGLPILGYSSDTEITAQTSRPGGHANYTKIDTQLSRLQAIVGPLSLYLFFKGQWAFNTLLVSEQFSFGGPITGRGYDVAEMIGDLGAAGTAELRYDFNIANYIQTIQFYLFYDIGAIWNRSTAGGLDKKLSGTSTGIGARFYFTHYLSGNVMWTQTLTRKVITEEFIGRGSLPRAWFSLVATLY